MRIAPFLVPTFTPPNPALWTDAALCAMLTHNDSAAIASCVAFVAMLWELLRRDYRARAGVVRRRWCR